MFIIWTDTHLLLVTLCQISCGILSKTFSWTCCSGVLNVNSCLKCFESYHLALLLLMHRISTMHTGLTFKNLEFWSSNSRISSSIFLILASAVTFSSCNFCRAPSSSSSCSSRSWEERQLHLCIFQVTHVLILIFFNLVKNMYYFEKPPALTNTKNAFGLLDSFIASMIW